MFLLLHVETCHPHLDDVGVVISMAKGNTPSWLTPAYRGVIALADGL